MIEIIIGTILGVFGWGGSFFTKPPEKYKFFVIGICGNLIQILYILSALMIMF